MLFFLFIWGWWATWYCIVWLPAVDLFIFLWSFMVESNSFGWFLPHDAEFKLLFAFVRQGLTWFCVSYLLEHRFELPSWGMEEGGPSGQSSQGQSSQSDAAKKHGALLSGYVVFWLWEGRRAKLPRWLDLDPVEAICNCLWLDQPFLRHLKTTGIAPKRSTRLPWRRRSPWLYHCSVGLPQSNVGLPR